MIVEAKAEDATRIEALLTPEVECAMFPLASLRTHGVADRAFANAHEHASRFWIIGGDSVIALTQGGMVLPLLAGTPNLSGLSRAMSGLPVTGAIGPVASVRPVLAALGLDEKPTQEDRDEPGFTLDLSSLLIPDLPGAALEPASDAYRQRLIDWRTTYHGEALGTPADKAQDRATTDIDRYIAQDSHRVLTLDGVPVAMTGFNAVLPSIVQVGGVFTPPALRGRGYARLAVALHLAEARANGAARAVLFAANAAAASAYQAIGFRSFLPFALVQFSSDARITPA